MKFIATNELGRLSRWLRILGFDTVYQRKYNIGSLIITALREDRFILTRKKTKIGDLEKRTLILKSEKLEEQIKEVIEKLNLKIDRDEMFTRCTICNSKLIEVEKEKISSLIPPYVYKTQEKFYFCNNCNKAYWQGSHWGNVSNALKKLGVI